ncbi:MAG TPA: PAS domain S-box protein [Verrucomicrobiae bacterium]|nr:PAS domain S-box protein [Verrucomicrobiae bacterium]
MADKVTSASDETIAARGWVDRWGLRICKLFPTIRSRLIVLVLLGAIPSLILVVAASISFYTAARNQAQQATLQVAHSVCMNQERQIDETRQLLLALSRLPEVRGDNRSGCQSLFSDLNAQYSAYANFGVADLDGNVRCSAAPASESVNISDRVYFRRAIQSQDFAVGDFQVGRITGLPGINCGYPIWDQTGRLKGVVFASLNLDWMKRQVLVANLPSGSAFTVLDRNGTILARYPDEGQWVGKQMAELPDLRAALLQGQRLTEAKGMDGIPRLYAIVPISRGRGFVTTGVPRRVVFAAAQHVLLKHLWIVAALTLFIVALTEIAARIFIVRWVNPLLRTTKRLSANDLTARARVAGGPRELEELARGFDQMAESLQRREMDQKRTENSLRESEEMFRSLSASSPLGIFTTDLEGQWTYVNPRCRHLLGINLTESLSSGWLQRIHPEDRGRVTEQWLAFIRRGGEFLFECRIVKRNGVIGRVQIRVAPVVSEQGETTGRVGTVEDITERKQAEEALALERYLLDTLMQNVPDSIYFKDAKSRFLRINRTHATRLGLAEPSQVVGKTDFDFSDPERAQQTYQDESEIIRTGRALVDQEEKETRPDGKETWLSTTKAPLYDEGGKIVGTFGISRDITARKHLEEQFRQAQKMEAIGRLAGGVAHDFNNILTAIIGYSDLVHRKLDEQDPLRSFVAEISKAGNRAAALTRQLLAFSRKQILRPVIVDLNTLVTDLEKMLRRLIGEDVQLETRCSSNLGNVQADPGQIEQVLVNLSVNARDAMPNGGNLTIATAKITLDDETAGLHPDMKPGEYVMLEVRDTGTGMTEEVRAHAFEPFFTTKQPGKGTGLGLATCFGIIKQSGGHIDIETEWGRGTTFKIYLPRVAQPAEYHQTIVRRETLPSGSETVLLVEDEPSVRKIGCTVLRSLGYDVIEATSGDEAIRLVQHGQVRSIDLLLTDVVMPEMNGRELADQILMSFPEARILFISGYAADAIGQHGVSDANVSLLLKPFTASVLAAKVREVLDSQPAPALQR